VGQENPRDEFATYNVAEHIPAMQSRRVVAGRRILPSLANGLRCLHSLTQVAALQTVDVCLRIVDVLSQRRGFQLGIFQPAQPSDRVIPHFAQSPNQLIGLCSIPFTHYGIVSPAGVSDTLNRPAMKREHGVADSVIQTRTVHIEEPAGSRPAATTGSARCGPQRPVGRRPSKKSAAWSNSSAICRA
jgi:hypothetical protein